MVENQLTDISNNISYQIPSTSYYISLTPLVTVIYEGIMPVSHIGSHTVEEFTAPNEYSQIDLIYVTFYIIYVLDSAVMELHILS